MSDSSPMRLSEVAGRVQREIAGLATELSEIELLTQQARTEATRHEQRRTQAADKVAVLAREHADPAELTEAYAQLVALTRRAAIMEAQVDVLEGKVKVITRFRESLGGYEEQLAGLPGGMELGEPVSEGATEPSADSAGQEGAPHGGVATDGSPHPLPPALSRVVLNAQEDLRRDIARAMHDGPAQSLTNIVLQVHIVQRLLERDPQRAATELEALVAMVQETLEATKGFIFDVRPMVLDDLGLVPTLRRAARERGQRAHVPIDFESQGADRRLPMDLESGLFRILDEAIGAYLSLAPATLALRLDWGEHIEARVIARRATPKAAEAEASNGTGNGKGKGKRRDKDRDRRTPDAELPDALRAMIAEQEAGAERAARAAARISMPAPAWREIQQRAATIGVGVELREDGSELVAVVEPPAEPGPVG